MNNTLLQLSKLEPNFDKHYRYLMSLKNNGFEPKVIYDIGACVLHWTNMAKKVWPNATFVLFDALEEAKFLYADYPHYIGVLSDSDSKSVKYYKNISSPGGNSYYKEIGHANSASYYPESSAEERETISLDTAVKQNNLPLPDFVKIDVQGCEMDILIGGQNTLKNAQHMIIEMQHVEYNQGAPKVDETLPTIISMGFYCTNYRLVDNGPDADYTFSRLPTKKIL